MSRRTPIADKRQCEEILSDGRQCSAWAMRSTFEGLEDPQPRCRIHSMSDEEVSRAASRAARANVAKRRGDSEPAARASVDPGLRFQDVAEVIRPALSEVFDHNGRPDWSCRLAACAVLLLAFPRYTRTTVSEAQQLLAEVLPDSVYDPERMEVEKAFAALRAEYWRLPAWHPVRGLVARELPRDLVPPWLDYAKIVRAEKPEDVPLAEARKLVLELPEGQVAWKRPGTFPVLIAVLEADKPEEHSYIPSEVEGW